MLNFGGVFLFLTILLFPSLQAAKYTETRIARNGKAAKQKGWLLKLHGVLQQLCFQKIGVQQLFEMLILLVMTFHPTKTFFFKALTLDIDSRKKNRRFLF